MATDVLKEPKRSPEAFVETVRGKAGLLTSGILTGDTLVYTGACSAHWITICDTAILSIELNDSVANTGTDRWGQTYPAGAYAHYIFDPPIEFLKGIYVDVSTLTCKVIVGYIPD